MSGAILLNSEEYEHGLENNKQLTPQKANNDTVHNENEENNNIIIINNKETGFAVNQEEQEEQALQNEEGTPNCITFRNISYSIDGQRKSLLRKTFSSKSSVTRKTNKRILHNIEGKVMEGEIMAILGPSGSGKSTFLEILGLKKKQGIINGDLQIYDSRVNFPQRSLRSTSFPSVKSLKSRIAFVDQANFLFPTSTVLEALLFSAFLRLPRSLTKEAKQERIREVVRELGIENILDSQIGSDSIRGLSGGEKRKLSCGIELLSKPLILLLDEPTSGLDSHNAKSLVNVLTNLVQPSSASASSSSVTTISKMEEESKKKNRISVIMTIHQPRREIFYCFSRLLVLEKGQVVYHGSPKKLEEYLASIDLFLPPRSNLADFLLDILFQNPLEEITTENKQKKITSNCGGNGEEGEEGEDGEEGEEVNKMKKEIELIPQNRNEDNYFSILANVKGGGADAEERKDDFGTSTDEIADIEITVDNTDDDQTIGHKKKTSSIMEFFHNFAFPPTIDISLKQIISSNESHHENTIGEERKGKLRAVSYEQRTDTITYKNTTNPLDSKMILSWSKSIYAEGVSNDIANIFLLFDQQKTRGTDSTTTITFDNTTMMKGYNSPIGKENADISTFLSRPLKNIQYSFLEYFVISQRLIRDSIRKPITMIAHNSASLYIGFLLGLFYYDLPLVGLAAVQNRMGVYMLEMLFFAITSISALPLLWVDKDLYKFEKSNGVYATGPYFTAKVAMDFIPNRLLPSWIVVILTQYMIGFGSEQEGEEDNGEISSKSPFFTYFVGLSLIAIISASFNFLIGTLTSNIMTGLLTSSFLLLHFLLLTGIFNNFEQMEIQWLKIFPYLSFFNYGYDMLISNELQGREVEDIPVNIDAVLIELGFHPSRVNMYLFILFCYFLVIITIAYFVLKYRVKENR